MLQIFQGIVNIFPKFGLSVLLLIYPRKRRQCSFRNEVSYQIFHSFLVNHYWSGSFTLSSFFFYCFDLPFLKKPEFILTATKCIFFNLCTSLWSSANPTKLSNTLKQFVGNLPTNCLGVFDRFVILTLKEVYDWISYEYQPDLIC